jgi:hypothetical protein
MKKVLFVLGLSLMLVGSAFATPFLTCDPYDSTTGSVPTHFYSIFDNGTEVSSVAVTGWGPATSANLYTMKHDLAALADGNHTMKARACIVTDGTIQDCSDYSAVWSFSKAKPNAPSILSIKEGVPLRYYLTSPLYANSVMGGPPSSFNVSVDGGAIVNVPALVTSEGSMFKYEITNIATGTHTLNISAVNDWGTSATVAYTFQRYVVIIPKSMKILK